MIRETLDKGKKVTFIFDDGVKHIYRKENKGYTKTIKGIDMPYSVFIPEKLIDFELKIDKEVANVVIL